MEDLLARYYPYKKDNWEESLHRHCSSHRHHILHIDFHRRRLLNQWNGYTHVRISMSQPRDGQGASNVRTRPCSSSSKSGTYSSRFR